MMLHQCDSLLDRSTEPRFNSRNLLSFAINLSKFSSSSLIKRDTEGALIMGL